MLHIGSNGINPKNVEDIDINTIAVDAIINIAKKCSTSAVEDVVVSSSFLKRQLKLTNVIGQENDLLKDKCKENNFHFVCYQRAPLERWYPS